MDAHQRTAILLDLIFLRIPVDEAVSAVRTLPWDSDDELAVLDRTAAVSALHRYRSGELTEGDLEAWAEAIEGREDVGFEPGHEETLSQFVFETANPTLAEALSDQYAVGWIERMTSSP
jgi:hypothetical protein